MQPQSEVHDFEHPKLGREITAIGGHYVFTKEVRIPFNGGEVLYFVGYAVVNTSCCGAGGCAYAMVPGFILDWKYKRNSNDLFISQIDPIRDETDQKEVQRLIRNREVVQQVTFQ
jgi:hypothetical protein